MSPLTQQNEHLLQNLEERLAEVRALPDNTPNDDRKLAFEEMASTAHILHEQLEAAGIPVQHSRSMLKHRKVDPRDVGFYEAIHPVEDLIQIAKAAR